MDIEKFIEKLAEELESSFPTQVSPSVVKQNFIYGKSGERKGIVKSTPQSRTELVKEKNLNNLIPAFETGFEYLISAAYGTPLQQRITSEVKRLQKIVQQTINRNNK